MANKKSDNPRTKFVTFALTEEEFKTLTEKCGANRSEFIRKAVMEKIA